MKLSLLLIINPLNADLNPIFHLLTLLGAHHILHVSTVMVNAFSNHLVLSFSLHRAQQNIRSTNVLQLVYSPKCHVSCHQRFVCQMLNRVLLGEGSQYN